MNTLAEEVGHFLPLPVLDVHTDPNGMHVAGGHWRLRVNTAWQLGGTPNRDGLDDLVGDVVVSVEFPAGPMGLDIRLITRAGAVLEVDSELGYAEWLLSIWSPDDPRKIPIFDLEGPVDEDSLR